MQLKTRCLMALVPPAVAGVLCLAGCPTRPHRVESSPAVGVPAAPPSGASQAPRREGRPYDVVSGESLLTILAFRGGALAKAGHNHVIASHEVSGTFYVPDDVMRSTFELRVPVASLTVDEPQLRAKEGPDFPTEMPESAKEGTRRNMLSEALLSAAEYPEITLASGRIQPGATGSSVQADVRITLRGQSHTIPVAVAYSLEGGKLVASGELSIKQSDLGLQPFSAMLGALQVQDELRVRFHFLARAAAVKGAGLNPVDHAAVAEGYRRATR
jgi:polyisoprenoid-binding protein YceI